MRQKFEGAEVKIMGLANEIESRLVEAFSPEHIEVIDESEGHRGHAGFQEGGESHWRIILSGDPFDGQSRIERHRAIHSAIGKDILDRIHALAIEIL